MSKTSDLIAQLIESLENKPRELSLQAAYELGNALHGAMCAADWQELNWLNTTFEDVASELVIAEKNAATSSQEVEDYQESIVRIARMNGGI